MTARTRCRYPGSCRIVTGGWTETEIRDIVADYLDMLVLELNGVPYSKAEHRRKLRERPGGRSNGSIEYKHQNISAVLLEHGFPAIEGYKPARNYQGGIFPAVVVDEALRNDLLRSLLDGQVEQAAAGVPTVENILARLIEPPSVPDVEDVAGTSDRAAAVSRVDYLQREARNRSLGLCGEEFAVRFEQARLIAAGKESLAERVEHTSLILGDGAGFDVHSYEISGRDRYIEVKTTRYGRHTPFFVTANELAVSTERRDSYRLYRLFSFGPEVRLFMLRGAVDRAVSRLRPVLYQGIP